MTRSRFLLPFLALLSCSCCVPSGPTFTPDDDDTPDPTYYCPDGMVMVGNADGSAYTAIVGYDVELSRPVDYGYRGDDEGPEFWWVDPNPEIEVTISVPFCLDRYEYPNQWDAAPMNFVSHTEAVYRCGSEGKRLPSSLEWQIAAQAGVGWRYSYGEDFEPGRCDTEYSTEEHGEGAMLRPLPPNRHPDCLSPLGIHGLNGGVSEWTSTVWTGPRYETTMFDDEGEEQYTLMGGTMWWGGAYGQSSLSRHRHSAGALWNDDGFRCATTATRAE